MEPLSTGARAALDAYRREHAPDLAALSRVRARLAEQVLTPPPVVVPRGRVLRLTGFTVATALVIAGSALLRTEPARPLQHELEHPRTTRIVTHVEVHAKATAAPKPLVVPARARPTPRIEAQPELVEVVQEDVASEVSEAPAPSTTTAYVRRAPPVRTTEATPTLDAEVMQLRTVHDLLRAGEPLRALAALREHARRFPDGKLHELASVARVLASCDAGQREVARTEAASFLRRYPSSIHAARVREACVNE